MILGTSKISLNLGPIIGHFWARGPRIYGFSYTKILQNILESTWGYPQTYYSCKYENHFFPLPISFGVTKEIYFKIYQILIESLNYHSVKMRRIPATLRQNVRRLPATFSKCW